MLIKKKQLCNDKLIIALNLRIIFNLTSFREKWNEKGVEVHFSTVSAETVCRVILHRKAYHKYCHIIALKGDHKLESQWKTQ